MRGLVAISLMLAVPLTACSTAASSLALHELPSIEAPYWDLVSVKGLNEHLKKAHETDTVTTKFYEWDNEVGEGIVTERIRPVRVSHVDLEEFLKPRGVLKISGKSKFDPKAIMYISFQTCNPFNIIYVSHEGGFRAKDVSRNGLACWSNYGQKEEKEVYLPIQRFFDPFITDVLMDVTNYSVSHDGKTLTLLGQGSEELGVFKRKDAAE